MVMIKRATRTVLASALIAGLLGVVGCESTQQAEPKVVWQENGVPRHNNPARPQWKYTFVYHPDAQVYYEPYSRTYWWYEAGQWCPGSEPPRWLYLDPKKAVIIGRHSERPQESHALTLAAHPCRLPIPPIYDPRPQLMHEFSMVRIAGHMDE
jgi:hypothetical protein